MDDFQKKKKYEKIEDNVRTRPLARYYLPNKKGIPIEKFVALK
jgi:hypothetical protein